MRFFDLTATALAAAAMISGVSADAPAAPAYSAPQSSATTTYYVTRTVLRVVETVTATGNGTASVYKTTAASTASSTVTAIYYGHGNATTVSGSGSNQPIATYVSPPPSTGAAGKLEAAGLIAALGFIGLVL